MAHPPAVLLAAAATYALGEPHGVRAAMAGAPLDPAAALVHKPPERDESIETSASASPISAVASTAP
jgi:hypothetical protein